jgi:hypothetical protein
MPAKGIGYYDICTHKRTQFLDELKRILTETIMYAKTLHRHTQYLLQIKKP